MDAGASRQEGGQEAIGRGRFDGAAAWNAGLLVGVLRLAWSAARVLLGLVLALGEPLVALLVPVASLMFLVAIFFGFVVADPRFPRWGMLGLSVGLLFVYWLYVWVCVLVQGGGRGRD